MSGEIAQRADAELREQLQKLREKLDRMGPINLAAISEHQELDERHRFLSAQEQDLSNSIASLKEIIQHINRTTKEMFVSTFNELQQKFSEVFAQFFRGGRAELLLVEEPPLENGENSGSQEPGIEIVAQPPGKRLKSIAMLSGGEKTLTAMALLFASSFLPRLQIDAGEILQRVGIFGVAQSTQDDRARVPRAGVCFGFEIMVDPGSELLLLVGGRLLRIFRRHFAVVEHLRDLLPGARRLADFCQCGELLEVEFARLVRRGVAVVTELLE